MKEVEAVKKWIMQLKLNWKCENVYEQLLVNVKSKSCKKLKYTPKIELKMWK